MQYTVEFPPALFHEACQVSKTPKGVIKMKLVRYGAKGAEKPGLIDKSGQLRDLSGHVRDLDGDAYAPASLAKLAALDPSKLPAVDGKPRFGAPVTGISKFVAIGLNYVDHAKETGNPIPPEPIFFLKANTSLSGPNDAVDVARRQWHALPDRLDLDHDLHHGEVHCLCLDIPHLAAGRHHHHGHAARRRRRHEAAEIPQCRRRRHARHRGAGRAAAGDHCGLIARQLSTSSLREAQATKQSIFPFAAPW